MGQKKKKKGNGRPQMHPAQQFGAMVSTAALERLLPHIEDMVNQLGQQLAQQQVQTLETMFARLVSLEKIVIEKLGLTTDELADRVAAIEDEKRGFVTKDTVEPGDRVRVTIRVKKDTDTDFGNEGKLKIDNFGTGQDLGEELEPPMIGMKTGEVKEVPFGKDKKTIAQLKVSRISRQPKVEAPAPVEPKAEEPVADAAQPGETNNDSNAG